jgi:hypothetical protein
MKSFQEWGQNMCMQCTNSQGVSASVIHSEQVFITKDSGQRQEFSTGMQRDVQEGKPRYDLVDWPMIRRWAELMERGAKKYGEHNWKKAATEEECSRFKASALRHLIQWFNGESDEDHAAAVYFNISGAEMVKEKMNAKIIS